MLIGQMNDAESKMTMFSTAQAANSQEAEDKLQRYKVGAYLFSILENKT